MAYIFKKYEELTIWDDFMFAKAMKNQNKHIFVNPFGETVGMNDNLKNFLEYLKKGIATDSFTEDMEEEVLKVKNNEDWRVEYMTLEMREHERFKEGRAEGVEAGRAEGMKAGRAEGLTEGLYKLVQKGRIQVEDAADELNVSPAEVEADMEKKGYRIPASV